MIRGLTTLAIPYSMTPSVPAQAANAPSTPVDTAPENSAAAAHAPSDAGAPASAPAAGERPAARTRRGGRGRAQKPAGAAPAPADQPPAQRRAARPVPPALEQLAQLYPTLFGATFLPLKRGIFQDLMAAHPDLFEREALKQALGLHTRSTRYLQSVAAGHQRHDLQGQPVEAMAPEHVHHALLETHRRRQGRSPEDLTAKLRARIVQNIEASGLSREEYAERVRTRDEAANALLDEAFAELAARTARDEALLRAYESSGKSVEEFADMYGMDPRAVARTLHSARSRAAAASAPLAGAEPDAGAA